MSENRSLLALSFIAIFLFFCFSHRSSAQLWVSHPTPVFFSSSIDFVHKNLIFFYLGFEYFLLDLLEHRGGDFVKSGFSEEKILVGFGWIEGKTRTLQIAKRGSLGEKMWILQKVLIWSRKKIKEKHFLQLQVIQLFPLPLEKVRRRF